MTRLHFASLVLGGIIIAVAGLASLAHAQSMSLKPDAQNATDSNTACTGVSATVLAATPTRRAQLFVAVSGNTDTIYVCFGATCTTAIGTPLNAGGSLSDDTWLGAVSCIAASGTQNLRAKETRR